jgi:predicted permease
MSGLPPLRPILANDTKFEGYTPKPGGPQQNVDFWQWVTPSYLATMKIPVVAGRGFDPTDGPSSPPVVLINETLAHRFYPDENPIGRRLQPGGAPVYFTIVGIVKDVKQQGLDTRTGTELYIDYDQSPADIGFAPPNMFLVVRSTVATHELAGAIQRTVASLDPTLPVASLRSMEDVFAAATSRPHFLVVLLEIFGALAVTLAAIGTYGVLAYSVSQRRRELGIRMALGAAKPGVLVMVLGRGMKLAALGLAIGLAGAVVITRLASSLLFGVSATDPLTFVAVAGVMSVVALAACIIPAMNATRVELVVALRTE